jgi:ferritin
MIIQPAVADLMNEQLVSEFGASAQYLAIAIYFDEEALPALAGYFYNQAEEEREHAMKFVKFLLNTGAHPVIPPTGEVKNTFSSASDAVEFALKQEMRVTQEINNLVSTAVKENDHTSNSLLQWFVNEQVEEVDSMNNLLQTIKHAAGNMLWVEDYVRRNPQDEVSGGEN